MKKLKPLLFCALLIGLNIGAYHINGWLGGIFTFILVCLAIAAFFVSLNSKYEQDIITLENYLEKDNNEYLKIACKELIDEINADALSEELFTRYLAVVAAFELKYREE